MILGIEVAMTIFGIYLLATGKTFGNRGFAHKQLRWLGAFMLTMFPVIFVAGMLLGVVWVVTHPGISETQLKESLRWPAIGLEAGIAVLYVVIAILWERAIRKKAVASGEALE